MFYKYTTMNHPSEWSRFFDEKTGTFHYKHKGSGVIRDTLMTIGKVLKGNVKNVAKKQPKKPQKQSPKKLVKKLVKLLPKRVQNKYVNYCKRERKNR